VKEIQILREGSNTTEKVYSVKEAQKETERIVKCSCTEKNVSLVTILN
jgi:hypothetical protein